MFIREKISGFFRGLRHTMTLEGHGQFVIRHGSMILDFLLNQGVNVPHLCKLGDCARCKAIVLRGRVKIASNQPHALGDSEKRRGVFLSCRATPLDDCHIAILKETDSALRKTAAGEVVS